MSEVFRAVIFRGRVQGVGFRWTTAQIAERYAVRGWVRNEPDGSVRCEVAGDSAEVSGFMEAISCEMSRHIDDVADVACLEGDLPSEEFVIRK